MKIQLQALGSGLVLIGQPAWLCAQNLVPNPSFEAYLNCPSAIGDIGEVPSWIPFSGTPDYFNACSDTTSTDVPANAIGYQDAADGIGYVGLATYKESSVFRECIQAELLTPLTIGQPVHLSMRVAAGGFGLDANNSMQLASSGIGMRFSTQAAPLGLLITDQAALYMATVLFDTAEWVTLGVSYVPDSAYTYVQVGNFYSDAATSTSVLDPNALNQAAYAFVDDVCVSSADGVCLLPDGWPSMNSSSESPHWNLQGQELVVGGFRPGTACRALVFDGLGRLVMFEDRYASSDGSVRVEVAPITSGHYTVRFRSSVDAERAFKFVVVSP
ncbi:MAG: hypothetical protein IPJ76_00205 [Flavobacteriales bacterium]|nr:MAG: hypothetical protein IPJ76_00205 [Flavobacteriales bacterium]